MKKKKKFGRMSGRKTLRRSSLKVKILSASFFLETDMEAVEGTLEENEKEI